MCTYSILCTHSMSIVSMWTFHATIITWCYLKKAIFYMSTLIIVCKWKTLQAVILKFVKYNLLTGEWAEREDDGSGGQAFDKNLHKELAGTCELEE